MSSLKHKPVVLWVLFGLCMSIANRNKQNDPAARFTYPAVAYTAKDIQKIVDTIGTAGITTIVIGFLNNDLRTGKLELDNAGGTIQNANDYAAHMLLVLPSGRRFGGAVENAELMAECEISSESGTPAE